MQKELLLKRLDEIGQSLQRSGHTLALIGLGSVGLDTERLDGYSDLDFFAIVEPGQKQAFLDNLDWLGSLCPIAYSFRNTDDGYKLLFEDGVFCEFAVFEPDELVTIPFSAGRIVWKQAHVPETISQPVYKSSGQPKRDQEWLVGEALTNLYVGMARERRGEHLSAMRFIQGYAVDRLLELIESTSTVQPGLRDEFALERRFEDRHPEMAGHAAGWMQGYERNRESALAILAFLQEHFYVNAAIAREILLLCKE